MANSAPMTRLAAFLILLATALLPLRAQAQITVFAAASLRGVLEDLAAETKSDLRLSFGGSGTMARQAAAGAPADLVVLANEQWMDWLVDQRNLSEGAAKVIARNRLVVIGPAGTPPLASPDALPALLAGSRLAMGQREAVPAGVYAREWLEVTGLWATLEDQLAETDNVRAALLLVARGQAFAGIVYATDAAAEPAVDVIWHVPETDHAPILYRAVALTPAGQAALDLLVSPAATRVFADHGFLPVTQ